MITLTLVINFFSPLTANAEIVTIDPDAFAANTNISNAFIGITLFTTDGGAIFSITDNHSSTGTQTFGNNPPNSIAPNTLWFEGNNFDDPPSPGPILRVDFDSLTDFVAIDIINQDSFDSAILRAFDMNNIEIATDSSSVSGVPERLSISFNTTDIAYITIAGNSAQDPVHLDNLQFNSIVDTNPGSHTLTLIYHSITGEATARSFNKKADNKVRIIVKPKPDFIGIISVDDVQVRAAEKSNQIVRYRLTISADHTIETSYIRDIPDQFTTEWLQEKTFYQVWFGNGEDDNGNDINNVPVVAKVTFGDDGIAIFTGLLNSSSFNEVYNVSNAGLLSNEETNRGSIIVCGGTDQYIKTHFVIDGNIDNAYLYFFDETDALDFASNLTESIPPCTDVIEASTLTI